jgi:hypothetical protein
VLTFGASPLGTDLVGALGCYQGYSLLVRCQKLRDRGSESGDLLANFPEARAQDKAESARDSCGPAVEADDGELGWRPADEASEEEHVLGLFTG